MSEPISKAVKIVHDSGLDYRLTPMGTVINGDWDEVTAVIKKCHDTLKQDFERVMTHIKIDDTKESRSFDDKIHSVEKKVNTTFKK